MRQFSASTEKTLVTFHTGRGGRYYNSGHTTYVDCDTPISDYTNDLFVNFENFASILKAVGERYNLQQLVLTAGDSVSAYDRLLKMGLDLGEQIYTTGNGDPVGLAVDNDGTGEINIDNEYDTTVVMRLEDCSERELKLIYDSNNYVTTSVKDYCRVALGIKETEDAD